MAIPNNTVTHHHVGDIQQEFKAGIRAEDFPHIANLLINLYSDPIMAVVREYSTNALDSHISAGVKRPIEVTLPTPSSLEFVVQDFGIGLSVDDLRDVYSMYGRSLKRDSNDMVGQLGLGCKSGLTYADAFTIVAIKDGVKTVAMSTKDEHGVGTIKVLDTVGTTEPNGVRISIPVRTYDITDFREAADKLFQVWDEGTVLVDGKVPAAPTWLANALPIDDDIMVVPRNVGLSSSLIIMGNVPYQVPDIQYRGANARQLSRRYVARVNMGDVDFVPSREALHFTNWTNETIADLTAYVNERFDARVDAMLAEVTTRWDKTLLEIQWRGADPSISAHSDTPIWEYEPYGYSKRKASSCTYVRVDGYLTRLATVAITEFPNRNLAASHRTRLLELFPDAKRFIIIPTSATNTALLNGRGNTFKWATVMEKTKEEPKAKADRVKRDETQYTVLSGGPNLTAGQLAELDKVLWLSPNESIRDRMYFDATVIQLYSTNQQARLERLVPGIKNYWEERDDQRKAAEAALTHTDRQVAHAKNLDRIFKDMDVTVVEDPELVALILLARTPLSDNVAKATALSVQIVPSDWDDPTEKFFHRYPLLAVNRYHIVKASEIAEAAIYVNAKYAASQAPKVSLDTKVA